jgi:peptide deformylase
MKVKVKRYDEVRLRFQHHDGTFITRKFGGLAARVVQHEFDHLDGILHYNRANRFHRDQALNKWERALKRS